MLGPSLYTTYYTVNQRTIFSFLQITPANLTDFQNFDIRISENICYDAVVVFSTSLDAKILTHVMTKGEWWMIRGDC